MSDSETDVKVKKEFIENEDNTDNTDFFETTNKTNENPTSNDETEDDRTNSRKRKRKPATCKVCGNIYSSLNALKYHAEKHHKEYYEELVSSITPVKGHVYKCKDCGVQYKSHSKLKVHNLLHGDSLLCTVCNIQFEDSVIFEQHIESHAAGEHICPYCKKTFIHKKSYQAHLRIHTNERPFSCKTCGKSFKQKNSLSYHEGTHNILPKLCCKICNCACSNSSSLRRHMKRMHHAKLQDNSEISESKVLVKKIKYTCNVCEESSEEFDNKQLLRDHIMSSHNVATKVDDTLMCIICTSFFPPKDLEQHKSTHIDTNENKFVCAVCNRSFFNKLDIDFHMDVQHYSQIFCTRCEQIVTYFNYKEHVKKHETVNCKICGELLLSKRTYLIHLKSHEYNDIPAAPRPKCKAKKAKPNKPKNPLTCKTCNTIFKLKHSYEDHLKSKACVAIQCWICNVCGVSYTSKYRYEMHKLAHSDEKRFVCRICYNIKYKTPSYLVRHFKQYHEGKGAMFCTPCNEEFLYLSKFQSHTKKKHGVVGLFSIYNEGQSDCFEVKIKTENKSDESESEVENDDEEDDSRSNLDSKVKSEYVEPVNYDLSIVKKEENL